VAFSDVTGSALLVGIIDAICGRGKKTELNKDQIIVQRLLHGSSALLVQDGVEQEIPVGISLTYRAVIIPVSMEHRNLNVLLNASLYMECLL
jgi:hypothetical protein